MKVCIIGWYGTETLGDRAILAGILSLLAKQDIKTEVKLGSLFPFFSKRTIAEDFDFYKHISGAGDFKFSLFESKRGSQLEAAIRESDLLIMGGGPLMHINDLFMVDYAFRYSRKKKVPNMLFGCGVGPMFKKRHMSALHGIMNHADLPILRDQMAVEYYKSLKGKASVLERIEVLPDPSLQAISDYNQSDHLKEEGGYIAVNFREFPAEYSKDVRSGIHEKLEKLLRELDSKASVQLVPMHYFHIGGDDRKFMNSLKFDLNLEEVEVQNEPINLHQTFQRFERAKACVGMRFHSVVFQTALNGRNIVLDYTEPGKGKISGFLKDWDLMDRFAEGRYVNLQEWKGGELSIDNLEKVELAQDQLENSLNRYSELLKDIL